MSYQAIAEEFLLTFAAGEYNKPQLAQNLKHYSPLGVFNNRDEFLAACPQDSEKTVNKLEIVQSIEQENVVCVRYVKTTPVGDVPSCDWMTVENGQITEIHSFYDATDLRKLIDS